MASQPHRYLGELSSEMALEELSTGFLFAEIVREQSLEVKVSEVADSLDLLEKEKAIFCRLQSIEQFA